MPGTFFMTRPLAAGAIALLMAFPLFAAPQEIGGAELNPNRVILSLLPSMPTGGGYLTTRAATRELERAACVSGGRLIVSPSLASPSYCSGATYIVFLRALEMMTGGSPFSGGLANALAVRDQPDGNGVWGRWNANGPGTACLFRELQLGPSFASFDAAQPGDFMKIFWTSEVGRRERGHSVIFLGLERQNGVEMVRFWSSNKPTGFGQKSVPRSKIANAIFSRLEYPANIERAPMLSQRDPYLAGLLTQDSSFSEALARAGAR
jgi:hypothetical protein